MRAPVLLLFPILLALGGCGQSSTPPAAPAPAPADAAGTAPTEAAPAATPSGQELNQAIQQPLDKARAVEGQLMQDKTADDAAIDSASGG